MAEIEPWMREAAKEIGEWCLEGGNRVEPAYVDQEQAACYIAEAYARRPTPAGCEEVVSEISRECQVMIDRPKSVAIIARFVTDLREQNKELREALAKLVAYYPAAQAALQTRGDK
jgi:hypothetical protein